MAILVLTHSNQGRSDAAEELEVQVKETSKKKLREDHPDMLTSMDNLAFTWEGQGRDAEAVSLMCECVQRRQRIPSAIHLLFRSLFYCTLYCRTRKVVFGCNFLK